MKARFAGLIALGLLLVGSGCAVESPSSGSVRPSTVVATASADPATRRAADTQLTLDAVLAAVHAGDRSAFDGHLVPADSAFADRLFANLTTLPSAGVQLRAEPRTAELSGPWRAELPDGWAQQVRVATRLAHDVGPASYEIWLAAVSTPTGVRIAGIAADPDGGPVHRPLWMIQPVRLVTGPDATVLAAGRDDLGGWLTRAEAAERAVRTRLGGGADDRWKTGLVLELPSSERAFEQVLGVAPKSYHQIAAVAWPEGSDPTSDAVRVVVNPAAAGSLDADRLAVLITHEATHVLTRSASSPAPMWLVEGFADWVAFDRVPRAAPPTEDLALADVRRHGPPATLPTDADFRPDADDLDLRYARAWMLCRFIADTWSDAYLVRLYAEIDGGASESVALANVLGVDEQTLTGRWRTWLIRQAAG